jgi:DNA-binding response OmpR family regulator
VARVLLVDDDEDVQVVLGVYLERDGHHVVQARTAREALDALAAQAPDLVVLDLTLPDLDGLEVLRRIRGSAAPDVPVLVLTARSEESERVLGLGLGADDYVVKPFSPREVALRVGALLRRFRNGAAAVPVLRWGVVELVPAEHRVRVRGQEVGLTPREFALLELFLRHPHRVLTRSMVLEAVWPDGYVTDHVVDVHLGGLRRKLGDALRIEAVRGVGFRLGPPVDP